MELKLSGTTAFIAGSSRGIGFAIASAFLHEGANVVITGRSKDELSEAEKALSQQGGGNHVLALSGDMTDANAIENALKETVAAFGSIHTVVANIGSGSARNGWDLALEDWETALHKNLVGSMLLASASLRYLTEQGKGSLIFVSSIVAREAIPAPIPYSAAKAGLEIAMKNMARLVGSKGVRVNAVTLGNILFPGGSWERKLAERPEYFEEYIRREVPLQRFGVPTEIADAVVFLASERASFITGTCLVIDGGQTHTL